MRTRSLATAVGAAMALAPLARGAQAQNSPGRWQFAVEASTPARLLTVNEIAIPDSNASKVTLGFGVGVSAERAWPLKNPRARWSLFGRVATAAVNSSVGGAEFEPGRALILESGIRAARDIGPRSALSAGLTLSHWAGPDDAAPFAGIGAVLFGAEAGWAVRNASGRSALVVTANATRFGADETRNIATGFVWRFITGVRRAY